MIIHLNVHNMSAGYGGAQSKMHNTLIQEKDRFLWDYTEGRIEPGMMQKMVFTEDDPPPCYALNAPKYYIPSSDTMTKKTIIDLREELRHKGLSTDRKQADLQSWATAAGIPLEKTVAKVIQGYVGAAKGIKQVALEQVFVTIQMLKDDILTLDGYWKDSASIHC